MEKLELFINEISLHVHDSFMDLRPGEVEERDEDAAHRSGVRLAEVNSWIAPISKCLTEREARGE